MKRFCTLVSSLLLAATCAAGAHTFEIGDADFLLDGQPFKIHCGEIHYARIPRAYWRHRLQMLRAMGCNAVGCYMFWNYHEREPGKFTWEGRADAAAFCRMAQEEGLWVILRPGPYACAEWEGGGAPWWLMAHDLVDAASSPRQQKKPISMRSSDPRWLEPAKRWIAAVGEQLAPLQVTKGGPILMVQVENEYGLHGSDVNYIRALRQATLDAGFEVPLYACNPPRVMQNGFVPELFQAANFGAEPEQRFGIVRTYQPKGPMMCSEYYPAWFDTWGQAHHPPKSDREFFGPIDWMLDHGASFSLYMAHGGTSFGGWTGCRNPFVPNVTSYDYEAPISEQGAAKASFAKFRDRMARYLNPGETIPEMPAPIPVKAYGTVALAPVEQASRLLSQKFSTSTIPLDRPVYMEQLGQGFGLVSYERDLAPGESGALSVDEVHDFGYVYLDGQYLGTLDRRHRGLKVQIPPDPRLGRALTPCPPRHLAILLEAMGRINSSQGMEDRKGLSGNVWLGKRKLEGGWTARLMPIDPDEGVPAWANGAAAGAKPWRGDAPVPATAVNLYRGNLKVAGDSAPADTFLDLRGWTKGIVWVNGHNLGRYWVIGPQQTLYLPGCWLKPGDNEVTVLDFFGPRGTTGSGNAPVSAAIPTRATPILTELHPELDFSRVERPTKKFVGGAEVASGTFPNTDEAQVVMFEKPVAGTAFTLQAKSTYDAKNLASVAEFDLLDRNGNPLTSIGLTVTGVDSEEEVRSDGTAENAIDGQVEACWLTSSRELPHWIEFTAPKAVEVCGFRYTPCAKPTGRIGDYAFFVRGNGAHGVSALPSPAANPPGKAQDAPQWELQGKIDALAAAGGGTLTLKAGTYRTGALFFKPGVNLHLDKGATIVGVDEAEGYPLMETRIEGETCTYYPALVNADHCDGFTISGEGVIDGHGANTWEDFWTKRAAARKKGGEFRNKDLMRPRVLYVSNSRNVDVSGVTFKNSKFWTTHYYNCEDVTVHDCTIVAEVLKDSHGKELKGPSSDAVDIDKCRRFTVRNCVISVNDDGVVIKGGKGAWANDYAKHPENGPSSDVLIENCVFRAPTHSCLTLGSECPEADGIVMRNCTMDGPGNLLNLKMRTDTPQHYSNVLVEGVTGRCKTFLNVGGWSQYADFGGRSPRDLKSHARDITLRNNTVTCTRERKGEGEGKAFDLKNLVLDNNRIFILNPKEPGLAFDGYKVRRRGTDWIFSLARARSEIYARYDEPLWKNLKDGETLVRNPAFETRFLNCYPNERHGLRDYVAASGCNLVQLGRLYGVSFEETFPEVFAALSPDEQKALRKGKERTRKSAAAQVAELHALDVSAYPLLYGCDAMKWNKSLCTAFLKAYPSAKGVDPGKSWEKGILCPSDPATAKFIEAFVYEVASNAPYEGLVATFWDDYGLNCHCDRCKANGNDTFGNQVAFAVACYERACAKAEKNLIVRTWASGASHWLGEEWVHAPGYGGPSGEPISVWGKAYAELPVQSAPAAGEGPQRTTVIQTKVYNCDCQPNAPFSLLLGLAGELRPDIAEYAEWQITGQTVGLQWLPASVVADTAVRMREARRRVGTNGGVALYTGGYRNRGYDAIDDVMNSVNLYAWRELSWNPDKNVDEIWNEWSARTFGKVEPHVIAALKASERAAVVSFSPLGLGAPTESKFPNTMQRRIDLLRYTNRFYLPEGEAALAPTRANIDRVVAEKDAALASVDGMLAELAQADIPAEAKDEMLLRTKWLRAHLVVTRALDGALWRARTLQAVSDPAPGVAPDAGDLAREIAADFDTIRKHGKDLFAGAAGRKFSFYARPAADNQITLGSPVKLMRDIAETAARRP